MAGLKIVGVCRFSFLGRSDWRTHRQKSDDEYLDDARKMLFDDARLAKRFATFERLTIRSLAVQDDKDFDFVVVTSTELPAKWRKKLDDLAAKHPFLSIEARPVGTLQEAVADIYDTRGWQFGDLLQFRLDDDDGVGQGYISRMRHLANGLRALDPKREFAITFSQVLNVARIDGALRFYKRHWINTAAGQAIYHPKKYVYGWAHHLVSRQLMTIIEPNRYALQTFLHGENDSGQLTERIIRQRGWEDITDEHRDLIIERHFKKLAMTPDDWQSLLDA